MIAYSFEASGKLKVPSEQELEGADSNTAILTYTSGTMADGRPYYCYIAVMPSKYREFHVMTTYNKPIVLGHYGEIVRAGFAAEPPPEVVQEMRDLYGYDEGFANKLKEEVTRQRQEFSAKSEEKNILDIVAMLKAQKPS